MTKLELLAPAKDISVARIAINCGADAIYIGAENFGARSNACNSIDDIKDITHYAHLFNVKVYVTLNTIIKEAEISQVKKLINQLYEAHVDALIVQDMSILEMDIPPISLHASTQCDIRSVEKAKLLEQSGFSQIVLARELTLNEIKNISESVSIPVEVFIHGALCVCYSGQCHISEYYRSRSANRGECAQLCRLPYDIYDGNGKLLKKNCHALSLKDLSRYETIGKLIEAGATSFKIEGRLKDESYVATTVAAYRKVIDEIIMNSNGKYERSSAGVIEYNFTPEIKKAFNRGFTDYFFKQRRPLIKMASFDTPKFKGERVGQVIKSNGNRITTDISLQIANGDGIGYFDESGVFTGVRVNKFSGHAIETLIPTYISPGTQLYRTFDKEYEDSIKSSTPVRKIQLNFALEIYKDGVWLHSQDSLGNSTRVKVCEEITPADKNQRETQERILKKLGDTHYVSTEIKTLDSIFIPSSKLAAARRVAVGNLIEQQISNYKTPGRVLPSENIAVPENIGYEWNVSNSLSERFYIKNGAKKVTYALEINPQIANNVNFPLMTTRYCLRRELGACLKTPDGAKIQGPISLRNGDIDLITDFNCSNCEMIIRKK